MFSFTQLQKQVGQEVTIGGFASTVRVQSKIVFLVLRSGAETVQCVCTGETKETARHITLESYVTVTGKMVASSQAPGGAELQVSRIVEVCHAKPLPVSAESEIGLKLEYPTARFREPREALVLKVQSELEYGLRQYLREAGFTEMHTPKLMGAPSESGAEVFEVGYFGEKAYLAQSPQFYKQMAIMAGLGKIFEIAPVFRAEPSFSSRHATEFISVDVELEGVRSEVELIELECAMLTQAMASTLQVLGPQLAQYYPAAKVPGPIKVLTFAQAQEMLGLSGDAALTAQEERELGAKLEAEGVELVALTQVPYAQRPFYHMREGMQLTRSFELLYRGVEITTGAVREHRHSVLMEQLGQKGLTGKGAEFYLEAFQYGAPPHGGFGLGLARLTALFLGLPGIKEASFIHRGPGRLVP